MRGHEYIRDDDKAPPGSRPRAMMVNGLIRLAPSPPEFSPGDRLRIVDGATGILRSSPG
jgi:hypothetical protein